MMNWLKFLFAVLVLPASISAQSSLVINAGPDTTLPCGENCFIYTPKLPSLKSTEDYRVVSIPYNPYAYTTNAPALTLPCQEKDDKYYASSALWFPFCFYGQSYQSVVIGTNGLMSFDISNSLNCCQWSLDPADGAQPIPFAGNGQQCIFPCDFPADVLYPRAAIMGVYHDLAIDEPATNKKVEFRVEGIAPFRRAIISFNRIPIYDCTNNTATHQVVLYETTGIIEVYVKDRPPCNRWNRGNAILGLQNWERNKAITPPNRNLGNWGSNNMNEAWQFIPDGNNTSFDHAELWLNNTMVTSSGQANTNNGITEVLLGEICVPADSNQYTLRAYYRNCANGTLFYAEDSFIVFKKNIQATAITAGIQDVDCPPQLNGKITITAPLGPNYTYSTDNISFQASPEFNLPPGTYFITVKDNTTGCSFSQSFTIRNLNDFIATASTTDALCSSSPTGSITVAASGGWLPYQFILNNGNAQPNGQFDNIPAGLHHIKIIDDRGCYIETDVQIKNSTGVSATAAATPASCTGGATGSITISASGGTGIFTYILNSSVQNSTGLFTNLNAGDYSITVQDNNGCSFNLTETVTTQAGPTATAILQNTSCSTVADGSITITATGGNGGYQYSNNNGSSYQPQNIFNNLSAGTYQLSVKDVAGCTYHFSTDVLSNKGVTVDALINNASCAAIPNGSISITPLTGNAPFSFSLNNAPYQNNGIFNGLQAGIHNITIKDAAGCTQNIQPVVGSEPPLQLDSVVIKNISCSGLNDGSLTVYARLGAAPYQYALNQTPYQPSNTISGLPAMQNAVLHIKDNSGCIKDTLVTVSEPPTLSISTTTEQATCIADGKITVTTNGGVAPYLFSINPGTGNWQSNSAFTVKPGLYTLTAMDSNGCFATKDENIFLTDNMQLQLGSDTTVCAGSPVTLQVNTNAITATFNWQPGNGLNNASLQNPIATPADTTTYQLNAIWGNCSRTANSTINVLQKPVVYAGNDTAICLGTIAFLHGNVGRASGPVSYLWQPADFLNNTNTLSVIASPNTAGNYTYRLVVTDLYNCNFTVSDEVKITMQPPVPAFAGKDTFAASGQLIQLYASGGSSYTWQPADLLNNPSVANPTLLMPEADSIRLYVTVKDAAGCIGTDDIVVVALSAQTYYVPNAFTPNGDGLNDVFKPKALGIQSTDYFRIFNRYGQIIFESSKILQGWDGTYKNKKQQPGAYIWALKGKTVSGRVINMKGTVMLIR
jgi:gliding motility-associated-like protein